MLLAHSSPDLDPAFLSVVDKLSTRNFFSKFICLLLFESIFSSVFKDKKTKSQKEFTK
jgi:hypothetical protein